MIDFGPEHTSSPGVRASSSRSALTSRVVPGVHAPDPARRGDLDARLRRRPHRGAHRGGAQRAGRHRDRVVATSHLRRRRRAPRTGRAARRSARPSRPRRRRRSTRAPRRPRGSRRVIRSMHSRFSRNGQALADHAGLERDHALPERPRHADLVGDHERARHDGVSDGHVSALEATSAPAWHARRERGLPVARRAPARRATPRRTRRPPRWRRPRRWAPRPPRRPSRRTTSPHPSRPSFTAGHAVTLPERARRGGPGRAPSATSTSRSLASSTFAPAPVVSDKNRSAPNASTNGHEDASTATNDACARSSAARPAGVVGSCSSR